MRLLLPVWDLEHFGSLICCTACPLHWQFDSLWVQSSSRWWQWRLLLCEMWWFVFCWYKLLDEHSISKFRIPWTGIEKVTRYAGTDQITVFWFITTCSITSFYRHFEGNSCLHVQCDWMLSNYPENRVKIFVRNFRTTQKISWSSRMSVLLLKILCLTLCKSEYMTPTQSALGLEHVICGWRFTLLQTKHPSRP